MKDLTTTSQSLMSSSELWPVGVKLGIVRLGRAAGKVLFNTIMYLKKLSKFITLLF
jgi:hypothetical protein